MRRISCVLLVGCIELPEAPTAAFQVRCADQACESVTAEAERFEDATYTWWLDDEPLGTGPQIDAQVATGELGRLTLQVENLVGDDRHSRFLIHTEPTTLDASGTEQSLGHGYIEIGDATTVSTLCPDKRLVTSFIGGCFTGLVDLDVYLSDPAPSPPPPGPAWGATPAAYDASGPGVDHGDWAAARAFLGGTLHQSGPDNWPNTLDTPAFQTLIVPEVTPRWMVIAGGGFAHKETASVSCEDDTITVGKGGVGRRDLEGWLGLD